MHTSIPLKDEAVTPMIECSKKKGTLEKAEVKHVEMAHVRPSDYEMNAGSSK